MSLDNPKIMFIEDAQVAASIRAGATDTPNGSVLDFDLVVARQPNAGYEVLKCSFAYPEKFLFTIIGGEAQAPDDVTVEEEPAPQALVHLEGAAGTVVATKETREEIVKLLSAAASKKGISVHALITVGANQPNVTPVQFWDEITVMPHSILYVTQYRP